MNTIDDGIFTGKTVEEAVEKGLTAKGLTKEQADIEVLDEGKKGFLGIGSTSARVRITKKKTDGERAADFIDGLLEILNIKGVCDIKADDDRIEIEIQTTNSHAVIGRHGEILDAIQCIGGAVANIGRDEYKKVVVDCENYRAQREETLKALALKLAKKAVEKGKKVTLEPMNPYERRIIHSALADSTEVKTASDGREPNRYVVIIPNNLKPYERRGRGYDRRDDRRGYRGDRRPYGERREGEADGEKVYVERREREDGGRSYGDRRERRGYRGERRSYDRRDGDRREGGYQRSSRPARGKKEIHFGTYLGNSKNAETTEKTEAKPDDKTEE